MEYLLKKKVHFESTKYERLSYYSYFTGQNIIYMFVTMFISIYFISVLAIPAITVGFMLLIARVWDTVNDPLLSYVVERTNFKGGKFIPWVKSVSIVIPIVTFLLFGSSFFLLSLPVYLRIVIGTIIYIIWGMVYTLSDAPAYALATTMTNNNEEKGIIISNARFASLIGITIISFTGPLLVNKFNNNWVILGFIIFALSFPLMFFVGNVKERVIRSQVTPTLKDIILAVKNNGSLLVIVITFMFLFCFNFGTTLTPFISLYIFNDISLTSILSTISLLPALIVAPFIPKLLRRFNKNTLFRISLLSNIIFSIISFFIARNSFFLYLILILIKGVLSSPILFINTLYYSDCIDNYYRKTGKRYEAVIFSIQTFTSKAIMAVSGAGAMFILGFIGFKESVSGSFVNQSTYVLDGMWTAVNLGPAFGALLAIIYFTIFYKE